MNEQSLRNNQNNFVKKFLNIFPRIRTLLLLKMDKNFTEILSQEYLSLNLITVFTKEIKNYPMHQSGR
jgi:hypothetical protein